MKGKKILLISNLYPSKKTPYYGSFVKNFEEELFKDERVCSIKGIYIKGFNSSALIKIILYFCFYLRIIFYSLFFKYDLIYVHLISHSTLPLRLVNYVKKLPLIFNIHGEDLLVTTPLAAKLLKLSLPLVKKAKFLVVPSKYFKGITMQELPDYPREKIIISASGGIKDIFKPSGEKKHHETLQIGYASRIDRGKGWDTLLTAAKILKDEKVDFRLRIAGGGPQYPLLINMIQQLGISDVVDLVGPISHNALPAFYQSLDLFIFPTKLRESLGLVGLEAMACGVPVIGSMIGGLTDYIQPGINGYFFTPEKHIELAERIKGYISLNDTKKKSLREEATLTAAAYSDKFVSRKLFDTIL